MKFSLIACLTVGLSALQLASARYVMYFDQYHTVALPNRTITAGIDTVIMAFANSSLFVSPPGTYTPFKPVSEVRAMFDDGAKLLLALGGWGDTAGFGLGAATEASRKDYAYNVANTVWSLGFDGVDIDWEYPCGNGADYKQIPNSEKVSECTNYPLLLAEIKCALKGKLLTIAVPGLERDMIAFTPEHAQSIWGVVDEVNIMTYDLMNRRDNVTKHHTSVEGSLATVNHYLNVLGLPPSKANLGFAFYAKWFTIDPKYPCTNGLGCTTVVLEDAQGQDTGKSGAITFEASNYAAPPPNLTQSPDGSCGGSVAHFCPSGSCCSAFGFCGTTSDFCGTNCLSDYGKCDGVSIGTLFKSAIASGTLDDAAGAEYFYDKTNNIFWTWDTPDLIARKFKEIVQAKNLGGVMAWSLGEDSYDSSLILAMQKGVRGL